MGTYVTDFGRKKQQGTGECDESAFEKEMAKRFDEYEQGKIVPLSLEELEFNVLKKHETHL